MDTQADRGTSLDSKNTPPSLARSPSSVETGLLFELYKQGEFGTIAGVLSGLIIAAVFSIEGSVPWLGWWLAGFLAISAIRYRVIQYNYRLLQSATMEPHILLRRFIVVTCLIGASWGILPVLTHASGSFVNHQISGFTLAAIGAAGVTTLGPSLRAYIGFLLALILPVAMLLLLSNSIRWDLFIALALYGTFLLLVALRFSRTLTKTINIQLANTHLVSSLEGSNRELLARNQSLNREIVERVRTEQKFEESERNFRTLAEATSSAILVFRQSFIYCNPHTEHLTGYSNSELLEARDWPFIHPEDQQQLDALLDDEDLDTLTAPAELRLLRKNGDIRWIEITVRRISFQGRSAILATLFDITDHKQTTDSLHRESERVQVTLESIGDAVITTDIEGNIEYINPAAQQMTGCTLDEALGQTLKTLLQLVDDESDTPVPIDTLDALIGSQNYRIPQNTRLVRRGGTIDYAVEVSSTPMFSHQRNAIGTVVVIHDVTNLRTMAKRLAYQARHDPLTGLIGRREFESRLHSAINSARDDGEIHALLYMDLDQFKIVNDTSGHIAGDELLKRLASLLKGRVREQDTIGRLGGDEFGVLLPQCMPDEAEAIAAALRNSVKHFRFLWEEQVYKIGVSIGMISIEHDVGTFTEVLRLADSACYAAKERGTNRIHVVAADDNALKIRQGQMEWRQRLQRALELGQFRLFSQKVVAANESQNNHIELLIRLQDGDGNTISPDQFMAAAERYHLMTSIDRWVVDTAFTAIAKGYLHDDLGGIMINLSGQSLGDKSFHRWVENQIGIHKIDAKKLCFEITETALIPNFSAALDFIKAMQSRGCKFALDDFGTGLSSFAYLQKLPVDYLKIDGSFIHNMRNNPNDLKMVKAINGIGKDFGMLTVAEGIEDEETRDMLLEMGVDFLQGYLLAKPQQCEIGAEDTDTDRSAPNQSNVINLR